MSLPRENPVPDRVVYSEWVRLELKKLLSRAQAQGQGPTVLEAVKVLDARLQVYPQFGDRCGI